MKTLLRLNFAFICLYLFCTNCISNVFTLNQEPSPDDCTKSLTLATIDTLSEPELLKLLRKIVDCLKKSTEIQKAQGRQDDDDDDFELPSYVPHIIKVVGSVLSGNASAIVDTSLGLTSSLGGGEGLGNSIQTLITTLTNTITESRPMFPMRPTRRPRPTRGSTRRPPTRNRTRRTTTGNPLVQVTNLNPATNTVVNSNTNPALANKPPIIFVLPNIPNGISAADLAKDPNLLHSVVNQSITALQQSMNLNAKPNVNQNPQANLNLQQQLINQGTGPGIQQSINQGINVQQSIPPISASQQQNGPSNGNSSLPHDELPNSGSAKPSNSISTDGNYTFVTSQQPNDHQQQLLLNLLNVLTKLSQIPNAPNTAVAPLVPQTPQVTQVPIVPGTATLINATIAPIPTTTEDEYYYYYDDETTKAAAAVANASGTVVNTVQATTISSGDDDDEDNKAAVAAAAAAAAVIIKAGEANGNKTGANAPSAPISSQSQQSVGVSDPRPVTVKNKNSRVTTIKSPVDKDVDDYEEDYDSATTTKTSSLPIKGIQSQNNGRVTTKVPDLGNDEEDFESQQYSTLRSKAKATETPIFVSRIRTRAPPPAISVTTEENEEDDEENEKTTTVKKYIYTKTTGSPAGVPEEEDDEKFHFAKFKTTK